MAAVSHASVLLPFTGTIAPIVIWATQKEKSHYVAFRYIVVGSQLERYLQRR